MHEVEKKTITVTVDQHEAIVGLKRGKDTIYDVVDMLLESRVINDDKITELETAFCDLGEAVVDLQCAIRDLKKEMK